MFYLQFLQFYMYIESIQGVNKELKYKWEMSLE